ncbi:glycoside hydrolase family 3 C-terminal domain-containing protein [Butyrivibrio sp. INlla16]|uniref:glycoside hydrolase family 3 protein n=1 Tax=Butyrivibrio sp. INlla16 TaxID=1520807 RepID=UPI00088E5A15|nr:glycoside hydrolase family 3 protein [Butyrivibrio sp. INlla16]SDB03407.1 beta-glucosidase [Butyrivibrio sp. INlla16]
MGKTWDIKQFAKTARAAAAEGIVLLKNDKNALPLEKGAKIAVFGRSQMNYYKSGTGSGGMVNVDYVVGIYEALAASKKIKVNKDVRKAYEAFVKENPFDAGIGWAGEPWFQKEMPLEDALLKRASAESDAAVFIIGRTAGEDQDNKNEQGSYLLTDEEKAALKKVCKAFRRTIVLLNVGNIIDMKWVKEINPEAVLYVWQGGQEGGNAVLDVLTGDVNPSGKLSDTIAYNIEDYASTANFGSEKRNFQSEDIYVGYRYFETFAKDKVMYPFGFGLSYTTFDIALGEFDYDATEGASLDVLVTNTGNRAGKEVVQVYVEAPQGVLGKPSRALVAFAKTDVLKPGQMQSMEFDIPKYWMSSYDDGGATKNKSSYVMEAGTYRIYAGSDVRSAEAAGEFELKKLEVICKCEESYAPVKEFERLKPCAGGKGGNSYTAKYEKAPIRTLDPNKKRKDRLPKALPYSGDKGFKLKDVEEKNVSIEGFIAQLSDKDLIAMMRGEGMCSPKVTAGIAGAYGGVTDRLSDFGIPVGGCSDGPSGIRMDCGTHAFSLPNGTCLACTFDEELNEKLFNWEALDLRRNRIDALLGPGMNIHRNPLNGRNFEYFSEDPILTGKLVSAQLRGLHKYDVTGVIKHFAGNTQEYKRHFVDNVVSERALREIYLKGFEIAVREGKARALMSTYGPLNGIWTASSYDLLTSILREEWGFDGIVMTDWWAMGNDEAGAAGSYQNVSAQVRAQNDLNMVNTSAEDNSNKDDLDVALAEGRLTRAELVRSAINICKFLLKTPAYRHLLGEESVLDKELAAAISAEDAVLQDIIKLKFDGDELDLDASRIKVGKGETTTYVITSPRKCLTDLELVIRANNQPDVAQLPFSVFQDKMLVKSVTLTGMDKEWQTIKIGLGPAMIGNFYLKLYFAQGGLEIKSAKIIFTKDIESMFRHDPALL